MNANVFQKNGYLVLRSVISNELRDFITQYTLFDEMQDFSPEKDYMPLEAALVPESHSKYADPAMETLLLHLHTLIEKNTGLKLFPTYSYYRVYRPGDDLRPHTDRPSCEISATMCINFNYDINDPWAIFVEGNKRNLLPGDLVIYKGCELTHWREKFQGDENCWHIQAFLHYVDQNGPKKDFKWDKRSSIGLLREKDKKLSNNVSEKKLEHKNYIQYTK